jgi:hypothetical protein
MLIKTSNSTILNRDEILSVEKSIRNSLLIYFKGRKEPCSYIFSSYEERNTAFERIIKEKR